MATDRSASSGDVLYKEYPTRGIATWWGGSPIRKNGGGSIIGRMTFGRGFDFRTTFSFCGCGCCDFFPSSFLLFLFPMLFLSPELNNENSVLAGVARLDLVPWVELCVTNTAMPM